MSKKAKQAREKQIIEDSTFGLKNKNKSKKVQQFVSRVERSAKQATGSYDKVLIKKKFRKKIPYIFLCFFFFFYNYLFFYF